MQDTVALGAYTEPSYSAPIEQRQLEWWEPWRVLLPLMIFLSVVGQIISPIVPDLRLFTAVPQILALVFAWYIYRRVSKISPLPKKPLISYPGENESSKEAYAAARRVQGFTPNQLAFLPANFLLLSSIYLFFPHIYSFHDMGLSFTIFSFLVSLMFVLIWPRRLAYYKRITEDRKLHSLLTIGYFATLAILFAFVYLGLPQLMKGSPAPWSNILAFAQREADKVGSDAVLDHIMVSNIPTLFTSVDTSTPLQLDFYFYTSEHDIVVSVADTNPPRLLSSRIPNISGKPISPSELEKIKRRVANITLGPRDIYIQTEAESRKYGLDHNATPTDWVISANLYTSDYKGLDESQTLWTINYSYDNDTPTRYASLILKINATDGTIFEREEH